MTEILGWRGWKFDEGATDVPILSSFNGTRWDGPVLHADRVPDMHNENGIYSLKKKPMSEHEGRWGYFTHAAYGLVALSGKVVEAEDGYRAQTATVRKIWLANHWEWAHLKNRPCRCEMRQMLWERYQCDIEIDTEVSQQCVPAQAINLASGEYIYAFLPTHNGAVRIRLQSYNIHQERYPDMSQRYYTGFAVYTAASIKISIEGIIE